MEYKVIFPEEPLECPMVLFKFVTDNYAISFIIKDKFSEKQLKSILDDFTEEDVNEIVNIVKGHFSEENIGETKLSEITVMAKVQCVLPIEDQKQ